MVWISLVTNSTASDRDRLRKCLATPRPSGAEPDRLRGGSRRWNARSRSPSCPDQTGALERVKSGQHRQALGSVDVAFAERERWLIRTRPGWIRRSLVRLVVEA